MISINRVLSGLLATSLLSSGTPAAIGVSANRLEAQPVPLAAAAAEDSGAGVRGKIEATVRLDFAQTEKALRDREVKAVLEQDGKQIEEFDLWKETQRTGQNNVKLIDLSFDNLEQGEYTLTFTGKGYKTFTTDDLKGKEGQVLLKIDDYSRHLTVGTGDSSFTLGDLAGGNDGEPDGTVDDKDVKAMKDILKKETLTEAEKADYDLNGDGEVDVIDLAIVNHSAALSQTGDANMVRTERLTAPEKAAVAVEESGTKILSDEGSGSSELDLETLMDRETETRLSRIESNTEISEDKPVTATIEFDSGDQPQMTQMKLLTTQSAGEIQDGTVTVEYEDGTREQFSLKDSTPDGVFLLGENGENVRTVVINLGKRVPVKKITITVTKTADNQYASVAAVKFLEDIVPDNPMPANVKVCGLRAEPGNAQVTLQWSALPNVTGYEIVSYLSSDTGKTDTETAYSDITSATITGLENSKKYTFEVTPVSREGNKEVWRGVTVSTEATPETTKIPAKVNMVNVREGDGQLIVSWKAGKEADTYNVKYTSTASNGVPDMSSAKEIRGIEDTNITLTGLENKIPYYITVSATNRIGTGPESNVVSGTPKAVSYEVELPTQAILEKSKIASVKLVDPGNVAAGSSADYIMDDNYQTHWTAVNWHRNEHIEVTFTEPVGLSAALWVPRLDGNYPNWLRVYAVRVWTDEAHGGLNNKLIVPDEDRGGKDDGATGNSSAMHTWPSVRNDPSQTKVAILPFGPLEGITKIQVAVEQVGYNLVSCSELKFVTYKKETDIPTKIDALFADSLHTELKAGVTGEQITELENLLEANKNFCLYPDTLKDELALAKELLQNENATPADSMIKRGVNSLSTGASVLQPLGVSANANTEITVYADIPAGETVNLHATQANAEASAWRASLGSLVNGRNVIRVPKIGSQAKNSGGSLYFTYSGTRGSEISLHVRRATPVPTLDVVNWYQMDDNARTTAINNYLAAVSAYSPGSEEPDNPKNVTEISTPSVLLSVPVTAIPSGATVDSIRDTILAWEQIMDICRKTHGMDPTPGTTEARQNVRCMQMFEGAFMYAAGSHIGIGSGSCPGMLSGEPVPAGGTDSANKLFGWGIGHEIGHNMDSLGKAEITNNIYAIMVQTYDGGKNILPSRLEGSGKYAKIFTKTAQARPGASNDVFVQLGMYWQLHLAYDDGTNPLNFYNSFFKKWNAKDWGPASTYDERVAVVASKTAGKNLTAFFEHWGMTLSETVKNELKNNPTTYANESRAIWYLNDQSRRDRLAGESAASGTITVTATVGASNNEDNVDTQKDVTLTITPSITDGTSGIQGYEIRRNGTAIDFVEANEDGAATYIDHVGSANNQTFTYSVVAYDTLGNQIGQPQSANEVRIAYDMTVPATDYEIARSEGKVIVTFKNVTQISGLKLLSSDTVSAPTSGAYTVTATVKVTNDDKTVTEKTVTARTGSFDSDNQAGAGSYLTYFNKPGTDSTDTRIWTYDAKTLEITGIPANFPTDQIQIVSYAGDDVAFYPDAAVGRLANDCGKIKAGTLVVVGTYRGSPVYSSIFVQGEFTKTTDEGEVTSETRDVAGDVYLFAEVHADKDVSDISDGLFIFVPNVQQEAELQHPADKEDKTASSCSGTNLLPSRMRIVMKRSNEPDQANGRTTATTLWIETPGGDKLPQVVLQNN